MEPVFQTFLGSGVEQRSQCVSISLPGKSRRRIGSGTWLKTVGIACMNSLWLVPFGSIVSISVKDNLQFLHTQMLGICLDTREA